MTRRHLLRVVALVLVALVLGTMGAARATTLRRMSADELAAEADIVVYGDVVRVGTRMRAVRGELTPETVVVIRPREMLMGASGVHGDVEVVQRGGRFRGGARIVHGNATFRRGDEVVVFGRTEGGLVRPVGMSMGAYFAGPADASPTPAPPVAQRFSRRTDGARVLDRLLNLAQPEPHMSLAALRACVHEAVR